MKDKRIHLPGDCEQMDSKGCLCTNEATLKVVRLDGTSTPMCRWCAKRLRDFMAKYPGAFEPVEFRTLH